MNCNCAQSKSIQADRGTIVSVSAVQVANLLALSQQSLTSVSPAAASILSAASPAFASTGEGFATNIHLSPEGDALVTSSFTAGNEGNIVLRGTIGPFPYEIHIKVVLNGTTITVTLQMLKPFEVGPFEWKFELGGVIRDANDEIVGAATVTPVESIQAMGLNWFCVLRCGGTAILPTLLLCLPSLGGGPAAYVACVVAKIGLGDAAKIAQCVAEKCT